LPRPALRLRVPPHRTLGRRLRRRGTRLLPRRARRKRHALRRSSPPVPLAELRP
jgi:hypothetical protein